MFRHMYCAIIHNAWDLALSLSGLVSSQVAACTAVAHGSPTHSSQVNIHECSDSSSTLPDLSHSGCQLVIKSFLVNPKTAKMPELLGHFSPESLRLGSHPHGSVVSAPKLFSNTQLIAHAFLPCMSHSQAVQLVSTHATLVQVFLISTPAVKINPAKNKARESIGLLDGGPSFFPLPHTIFYLMHVTQSWWLLWGRSISNVLPRKLRIPVLQQPKAHSRRPPVTNSTPRYTAQDCVGHFAMSFVA